MIKDYSKWQLKKKQLMHFDVQIKGNAIGERTLAISDCPIELSP